MKKIGVGVIGVGTWGENHVRAYTQNPLTSVVAVADLDEERAATVAGKYGIKRFYADFRKLLKERDIIAVSVATPDAFHKDPCVAAAEAGKHILVEKPMATNVPDADLIVKAARQASVKLMVDFHQRWNPACAHTKEAVKTGEIGKPMYVYTRLSNTILSPTEFIKWAAQTRVIWWLTVHTFDLARWFLEAEAKRVYAVAQSEVLKNRGIDTPDLYSAIVQFEGEKVANLESCWTLPNSFPSVGWGRWFGLGIDFKLELIGSNGAMYLDVMPNVMTQKYLEKEYTWPDTIDACLVHGKWSGFAFESINHFIECLASNKEPLSTGEDGLAATRAISAIEKSAESGQTVEI